MPEAVAAAIASYVGPTAAAAYAGAITATAYAITIAGTLAVGDYNRRRAQAKARAAANANAKDREVMVRSAVAPRRVIYGRDRVSGPIFYMESTGDKKQYLHLCIALAAHECDAIETVYFNETELPAPDGSGFITSGSYARGSTTQTGVHTGTTDGSGAITLPHAAVEILAAYSETGSGDNVTVTHHSYSHTSGSASVTGLPVSTDVIVSYTFASGGASLVRIRKFLGTDTQVADADLVAESAGLWTVAHRARGVCYLYVRLEYDQEVFGSVGVPNISAVVRGKKVYDPRTTTTAWSDNAALCLADWLRSDEGLRASSAEVPDAEVIAAANICDEDIDLDLGGTVTQPRYTCNASFTTERSPRDALAELAACMAGRAVWTQGRWLVRAGAYRTPTLTITADMLAGPLQIVPRAARGELFNAVRATYRDPDQGYVEVQAPLVVNAGYEAADGGVQIVRSVDVPTLADSYRAQRLAKIELERARQALTVRATCNLAAYDLAPTDTAMLTLATYGFSAKVFEVLERTFTPEGLLQYTLRETAAGVWDWAYGEATIGDLAPNTVLPSPFAAPAALAGLGVVEQAIRLADGTIVTQAVVSWTASTSPFVTNGGSIQYQAAKVDEPWGTGSLPGDATSVVLGPLQVGVAYVFRARAVTANGRAGDWAYLSLVALGVAAPPADVTGLAYVIKPGQVQITWTACPDADYAATELRYGGTGWDDATFLWRGAGTEYQHPRPANGTYTVRAKHRDTSGVYSATVANLSVTVDDSIDPGAGLDAQLLTLSATGFAFVFADANATTSSSPAITFTANLQNVTGTVAFSAEGFNASGTSLGAVTLTSVTATTAQLTATNFVDGQGTAVRSVRITATLGALSDTYTVYRGDDGTSTVQAALTNEAHTLPADSAGTVTSYANSGTEIRVFEGLTELSYDGVGTAAGRWKVTTSASNITRGTLTDSGTYLTVGNHSAMTADQASITYTIDGKTNTGAAFTLTKVQTFAKSRAGADGADGADGSNGTDGARGSLQGYAYGQYGISDSSWSDGHANRTINNMLTGASLTTTLATTSHLRIGDQVTESNGTTFAETRFWSGSAWLQPGTVISGNLLVGGTISGEIDLNITGSARFEGINSSESIPDPFNSPSNTTRDIAVVANTSSASAVGVYGRSASSTGWGLYGYNSHTTGANSAGVMGLGYRGVRGVAMAANNAVGVYASGSGNSGSVGLYAENNAGSSGWAARIVGNLGARALDVVGASFFDKPITITQATGTAPFTITSTTEVANLNVASLKGKNWAAPDPIGSTAPNTGAFTTLSSSGLATLSSLRVNQGSSSGTAQWNLPNGGSTASGKPGANSTGVFVPLNMNGVSGWILWWPN